MRCYKCDKSVKLVPERKWLNPSIGNIRHESKYKNIKNIKDHAKQAKFQKIYRNNFIEKIKQLLENHFAEILKMMNCKFLLYINIDFYAITSLAFGREGKCFAFANIEQKMGNLM